ncbi:MAG: TolC family protein [Candidatus Latescibacteria bacterium]|nr:TolC family protein [Candidatus Latescibacterota bacterium]
MRQIWSTLLCAVLLAAGAAAQEPLSLQALIEEALQHNPEIHRASRTWEAARTRPPQEGALPDPMLQVGLERNPVFVREINVLTEDHLHLLPDLGMEEPVEAMNMLSISVAQEIPYPGKRSLRRQVAEKNAEAEAARRDAARNTVTAQVKEAYYDLALADQGLAVVARTRRLLEDFSATALARYRVGQASQQEVLKAQVELSALRGREALLHQQGEAAGAQLDALLNRPAAAMPGQPDTLPAPRSLPPLEVLVERAREHHPGLQAQRRQVEAARLQVALMAKEYRPDLTLSAGWKTDGGLDDYFNVMIAAPLPLQRERRRSSVQGARAEQEASQDELRAAEALLVARIRDLASQANAASRLVELYRQALIPQARFALDAGLAGYRVGQVDLLMLLDNSRALLEDELMVQDQLAAHHRALAQLEEAVGASLDP